MISWEFAVGCFFLGYAIGWYCRVILYKIDKVIKGDLG